jgi:hypothetical protein
MYYAEKVINGLLHYRYTPDGEWLPMTAEQLTALLLEERGVLYKFAGESE